MAVHDSLCRIAKGEVLSDDWNRLVYSVDASHYQVEPQAIVHPIAAEDVRAICEWCAANKVPIGPRGSGTGLLGQSLTDGVVLDFTRHMNKIVEIADDYVIVQPGLVKGVLDGELRKKGKFLPVDPASSNYCSIGGMISNNSSGIHCLGYGNMIDFLDGVDLVYCDGSEGYASASEYDEKCETFGRLVAPERDYLLSSFPKVNKNSCGYRIDAALKDDAFLPHRLFAAAEGTLGIITEAKLRILNLPEQKCLSVFAFDDLLDAVASVPAILKSSPIAIEMMDQTVVSADGQTGSGCLLFVEFAGKTPSARRQSEMCTQDVRGMARELEHAEDESSIAKIWAARRGALNNIMKLTVGSRKPIGLIEDTVVPNEALKDHVGGLLQEYRRHGLDYVMYGHVGDGNVHTRPVIDLASDAQIRLMEGIANRVFCKVAQAGGTITGEHGDGIARLPYIPMVYGHHTLEVFRKIKEVFDPRYLLNPGKKVPSRFVATR